LALAVRTNAAMAPDDGFEKLSTYVFIGKSCFQLIDVHNISSFLIFQEILSNLFVRSGQIKAFF
jgi:hypothetical protein